LKSTPFKEIFQPTTSATTSARNRCGQLPKDLDPGAGLDRDGFV
jgi:hypothetical protein